jgi:uncharacterized membrane protein YbhN (UPF0104 family)
VRLAITVVLLALVCLRSDIWSLPDALRRANVPLLAAMVAATYVPWLVNTFRWQRILAGFQMPYAFAELFRLNLAGVFYGLALPGQVSGEVLKALRIAGGTNQRGVVYTSIFLDRIYGLIGLALLGCIALAAAPPQHDWPGSNPSMAVLILATLTGIGVVALPWLSTLTRSGISRHASSDGGILGWLVHPRTADGRRPPLSMLAFGCILGLAAQALTTAIHWGVAVALGLSVSPLALTWIIALGTIVGMFPISLAGLGVREATYVGLLSLYGVSAGSALALSLTMFAILILLGLTGGILDLLARTAPPVERGA